MRSRSSSAWRVRGLLCLAAGIVAACSNGLTAIGDEDSAIDVGGPDDTGEGSPLDTDTDTDTPDPNTPPVADAGPDQTEGVGVVISLDGSASFDPDDDPLTYQWVMTARPSSSGAVLLNDSWVDPEFWADREGGYTIELTVGDGVETALDTVEITIENPNGVPVANAGPDQTVDAGDLVQLNGSQSYDPDSDPLTFLWTLTTKPSGSSAVMQSPTSSVPRFTADAAGTYVVQLVVNDGSNDSLADTTRISAQSADSGDCLSCSAEVKQELQRRLSAGDLASGPGLVLLPLLMLLWQRKRED